MKFQHTTEIIDSHINTLEAAGQDINENYLDGLKICKALISTKPGLIEKLVELGTVSDAHKSSFEDVLHMMKKELNGELAAQQI